MSSKLFWQAWPSSWKSLWYTFATLFVSAAIFMWVGYIQGASGVIDWETVQEVKEIETTIHSFRIGPFELNVPAQSYVVWEYLQGSDLHHNTIATYSFLAIFLIAVVILLTVFTALDGFWYYAAMSVFIGFVISLRLDALSILGLDGVTVPGAVLLLFLSASFYFKKFRPETQFTARLIVFFILMGGLVTLIHFFAEVQFPLLYLAMAAYAPAVILTILFIITVAHEIMASFVYIAGQGKSKTLRHFLIISAIYLVNVFITCLHEIGAIEWNFVYINLYLLFTVSALLGLWGFRAREDRYGSIFAFAPVGAFFYVGLGAIGFATVAQLLGNANDAALKVIRDLIIFSHAAFGLIFLTYVFANFAVMMAYNKPVYRVLYRPNRMPFFTFKLAGVIATLAFVFVTHWSDYVNHGLAGFYNYAGDLYIMQDNEAYGTALYDRSRRYAFQNHRANYALGMIRANRIDFRRATENFELANSKRPTDYSLVNHGNLYLWRQAFFPAIETFREGLAVRPSGPLENNLAYAYARIHRIDSALAYISRARESQLTKTSAETNFFAMAASELLPLNVDSVLTYFNSESAAVVGNAIALASLLGQNIDLKVDPLNNDYLNLHKATLLNNYIVANAHAIDTTALRRAYIIADDSINFSFSEMLKAGIAHAVYRNGNVYRAQQILAELAFLSHENRGRFNYVMGLWSMEQGNPNVAEVHFDYARQAEYKDADFYRAIALTEAQRTTEAVAVWDSIALSADAVQRTLARRILNILKAEPRVALTMNDTDKYQYARYRLGTSDTLFFDRIVASFASQDYQAQALLDMAKRFLRSGELQSAFRFLSRTEGLRLTSERLYDEIHDFELLLLASERNIPGLQARLNEGAGFSDEDLLEKTLCEALIDLANGDTTSAAGHMSRLATWNPFFEEGVLAAAEFYHLTEPESFRAYETLAEAIQVNTHSRRLLRAYAAEAFRKGLNEYAAGAMERLAALR